MDNSLFKSDGLLWIPKPNFEYDHKLQRHVPGDIYHLSNNPHCPTCRTELEAKSGTAFYCCNCDKTITTAEDVHTLIHNVTRKWEGFKLQNAQVYSLDLAPTHVKDFSEDSNYWVEARIGEKNGKRMAVVYFGEKKKEQTKRDYVQLFVDFDDEQLRFDKSNKNPMEVMAMVQAQFLDSETILKKLID